MKYYQSLLWMVLSLIPSAMSDDDGGSSVAVSVFKSSFTSSQLVPEILPAFNPSVSFYVGFATEEGEGALLTPGLTLTTDEAKAPFELSVENITNATNVTESSRFLLYMVGPDVPSRSKPTSRNVRHFLAGNLTVSSRDSQVLSTASLLINSSAATNEYAAPTPAANTGSHRYMYLLYVQPPALNNKGLASLGFNASNRTGFNITSFHNLAGLGPPIGGTFFEINTDTNSTTDVNATSTANNTSSTTSGSTSSNPTIGTSGGTSGTSSLLGSNSFVVSFGATILGALFVGLL